MAGKEYAQTNIKVGWEDADGVHEVWFDEGEAVSGVPKEQMDDLRENGALGPTPPKLSADDSGDAIAERDARIAELEAALAEAKGKLPPPADDKK